MTVEDDKLLDVVLLTACHVADKTECVHETGITLCVKGLLVSGVIISATDYLQSNPILYNLTEMAVEATGDKRADTKYAEAVGRGFIHLKHARFFQGGGEMVPNGTDGVFWRGCVAQVDGFFLGRITVSP